MITKFECLFSDYCVIDNIYDLIFIELKIKDNLTNEIQMQLKSFFYFFFDLILYTSHMVLYNV